MLDQFTTKVTDNSDKFCHFPGNCRSQEDRKIRRNVDFYHGVADTSEESGKSYFLLRLMTQDEWRERINNGEVCEYVLSGEQSRCVSLLIPLTRWNEYGVSIPVNTSHYSVCGSVISLA